MIGRAFAFAGDWLEKGRAVVKNWITSSSSQQFLDARWVTFLIRRSPPALRNRMALRMVRLSPHYFYGPIAVEHDRMAKSRQLLIDEVIAPHVGKESTVLDYGCGPGYAAKAASGKVAQVIGADIASGALEAAKVINGADNIRYLHVGGEAFRALPDGLIDLTYSFACIQHVTDDVFRDILENLFRLTKAGGRLILHLVIEAEGWTYEADWRADRSIVGRVKLQHGLNCFNRTQAIVEKLVREAGFEIEEIVPAAERTTVEDDIAGQHFGYFRKPA